MRTANQIFFDAQLRHAIGVARYTAGEAKRVITMLDKADKELTRLLKERLEKGMDLTSKRYLAMQADIRALRAETWKSLYGDNQAQLTKLSEGEMAWIKKTLGSSIPVEIGFTTVSADTINVIVNKTPFAAGSNAARLLSQWWDGLAAVDAQRVQESIQMGMSLGETVDQMAGRVLLTQDLTRANAAAVVRTAVNHVSDASRGAFFQANGDILQALMWSAKLDGKTTPMCRARDGCFAPIDPNGTAPEPQLDPPTARPPGHVGCRSVMVGILAGDKIADQLPDRSFTRSTKTGKEREVDFRASAKDKAGSKWKDWSKDKRALAVRAEKRSWAAENIGTVPGHTTYDQWLRSQPAAFQDDLLGPARGKLFREGLTLQQFVTPDGRELTLAELHGGV